MNGVTHKLSFVTIGRIPFTNMGKFDRRFAKALT